MSPTRVIPRIPLALTPLRRAACLLALVAGAVVALLAPAGARAATTTKVVRYDGWSARVPASWPVYRLSGRGAQTCVRFNRHAVYLGRPGTRQDCPAHAAGRTEAILVSPRAHAAGADALAASPGAGVATTGSAVEVSRADVTVTATYGRDPGAVRGALGVRSVTAASRGYDRRVDAAVRAVSRSARVRGGRGALSPDAVAHTAPSVYTGLGFDACSAPSTTTMSDWAASPFHAVGVYIGGANMACNQANLTAGWVAAEAAAGWHLIPIYVGLQAPGNGCGCAAISPTAAAAQGAAAAQAAIQEAQALGLGAGNPVYYDMENYTRTATASQAVLAFLSAWTTTLHGAGYTSGVYGSELSGIADLVAEAGTGYAEPDDVWIANWNGQQTTADPRVPSADWPDDQRLHQYEGGHTDDYGGASLSIDSDYVDGATAGPGATAVTSTIAAAPALTVSPQPDGTIRVTPRWPGQAGISSWHVVAGANPAALTPIATVSPAHATVVAEDAYPYFQVIADNAAGQQLGLSATVATPSHIAIFGRSAFVATRGPGGLPVACYAITGCRMSVTVAAGGHGLARTGPQTVPAGGGIVHFALSSASRRLVMRAGNAGLAVTVTARSNTGRVAERTMRLVRFVTAGRGPSRTAGTATGGLSILGVTDFVSHGWAGGILVACHQATPCAATPDVHVGRTRLATARAQTIGAGELGYLSFTMTAAGHARLMHATGNQLGVSLAVTGQAAGLATAPSAHAQIAIDAF